MITGCIAMRNSSAVCQKVKEFPMSLFNGTWKIDISRSKKWDASRGAYVPDTVGEEIITLGIADGVQNYEVLYGDDPVIRMGYTSRYDAPEWVPYAVRSLPRRCQGRMPLSR